jgi:predicted glycogen debranching enzyme
MDPLIRRMAWPGTTPPESEPLVSREWLVTNGLGGYASGSVSGVCTRRYHGLLVAALPAPLGRVMMLNHLVEKLRLPDGTEYRFGGIELPDHSLRLEGTSFLREFRLETGLPVWRYEVHGYVLEKHLFLPYMQNTVHVLYQLLAGEGTVRLKLKPSMHFRPHDAPVSTPLLKPYTLTVNDENFELSADGSLPVLRMRVRGPRAALTYRSERLPDILYRIEQSRGYEATGGLWSPGHFRMDITRDQSAVLTASTENWPTINALTPEEGLDAERRRVKRLLDLAPPEGQRDLAAELVVAADQFVITPAGRTEEAARARAGGDEVRTVIAGYYWFTDWGRDTMISLEGLGLSTGRYREAGYILRTFAHYVRDGLIPNLFPEGEKEGLYHTADATLWYFHALHRYLVVTGDQGTRDVILPKLRDIVRHHLAGTHFGIGVDPADGLLRQGAPGYQLTWMDAKVGDWVVTPRRGKAVEINALWYNALRLLEGWLRETGEEAEARSIAEHASRARQSFNVRFWNPRDEGLFDVVDGETGDDPACRPNQVFAVSLDHPVLDRDRWPAVVETVRRRLLTPVGLRSLAPGHPDYKAQYYGDLRARDAAYHQGTVWAWLIGPFVDAWLRVHPDDRAGARQLLEGFRAHLGDACIGSISEVFDAEPPYTPRGCIAQAWSVAEVLRAWLKTAD